MAKRYFVQLAHNYSDQDVGGWLMSEKLDGMRAYWDGGISRGMPTSEVPFSNTAKDAIRVEEQISTGLWSRGGKKIPAPKGWLDQLPPYPLDGELYMGRGNFQDVVSVCKGEGNDWRDVQFHVFARPSVDIQFCAGEICFGTDTKIEVGNEAMTFVLDRIEALGLDFKQFKGQRLASLTVSENDVVVKCAQERLPLRREDYLNMIDDRVTRITEQGGEGLMLASPFAYWEPHRTRNLLKVKTFQEGEGTVVGYVWGRKTNKGSKYANLMGELRVMFNGHEFGLSGFTDEERVLHNVGGDVTTMDQWRGGEAVAEGIESQVFPIGSEVRFKFRELTRDGKPKEARYWR